MCCLLLLVGYPIFFRPAAPPNLGWTPPQIWDGCTHVVLKTGTDGKRGPVAIQWNKKIGRKFVTIRDLAITLLLDAVYAPVGEHSVVATE